MESRPLPFRLLFWETQLKSGIDDIAEELEISKGQLTLTKNQCRIKDKQTTQSGNLSYPEKPEELGLVGSEKGMDTPAPCVAEAVRQRGKGNLQSLKHCPEKEALQWGGGGLNSSRLI